MIVLQFLTYKSSLESFPLSSVEIHIGKADLTWDAPIPCRCLVANCAESPQGGRSQRDLKRDQSVFHGQAFNI